MYAGLRIRPSPTRLVTRTRPRDSSSSTQLQLRPGDGGPEHRRQLLPAARTAESVPPRRSTPSATTTPRSGIGRSRTCKGWRSRAERPVAAGWPLPSTRSAPRRAPDRRPTGFHGPPSSRSWTGCSASRGTSWPPWTPIIGGTLKPPVSGSPVDGARPTRCSSCRTPRWRPTCNKDGPPDCWQRSGFGNNSFKWARRRMPHSGSWAQRLPSPATPAGPQAHQHCRTRERARQRSPRGTATGSPPGTRRMPHRSSRRTP